MTYLNQHCPCCHNPLAYESDDAGGFVAWCSVGRCASEIGDRGAFGNTPEEAGEALIKSMKEARDWE